MLGGNGTPDNYNAQIASSLYVRTVEEKRECLLKAMDEMRLEYCVSGIVLKLL
mgnify:CR=1 FL=1